MTSALCGGDDTKSAWRPAMPQLLGKRVTECCNWAAPVTGCEFQHWTAYGGYLAGVRWRCAPGCGCNVRPGLKRTAHLRHYEGADE